jgi:hypothetical protein
MRLMGRTQRLPSFVMTPAPGDGASGTRRRRPIAVPLAVLVVAGGLGTVMALGGLGDAPDAPPRQLGPGASLNQERFLTTFVGSRSMVEPGTFGAPGRRFVEIEMEVTNKGDETALIGLPNSGGGDSPFFAGSLLKLTPEIRSEYGPKVSAPAGDAESTQLQPGMATRVVIKYELPDGEQAPEQVRMDIGTFEFAEGVTLVPGWHLVRKTGDAGSPPTVAAQVTLPVQPKGTTG